MSVPIPFGIFVRTEEILTALPQKVEDHSQLSSRLICHLTACDKYSMRPISIWAFGINSSKKSLEGNFDLYQKYVSKQEKTMDIISGGDTVGTFPFFPQNLVIYRRITGEGAAVGKKTL